MSDYKLAIKIAGKLDGSLAAAVNGAKSMLQTLTGSVGGAITRGTTMLLGGNAAALAAIGLAAGKVIKESITQGMDFESAMAGLAGTAGIDIGSEAYEAYEQAARQVGATTNKSATESAEALKYMALAGWSVTDSIQALDGMVKLSSATGMDMARTSDLITDSMGALGLTMEDYGEYMDFVATADAAANYTAEDFLETMIRSGGAARTLGIGYQELAVAAGVLANNGEKGTKAGTSLNSILRRMATNGNAVTAMADNGIKMFDEATGEFRGFETVLKDISAAMDGMTAEERIGFLSDLAGRYTSQFQYLLDSVKDGGSWSKLADESFADVAGNLEQRYKSATDTLQGDLDILKSAAADFGIEIYQSMVGGTDGLRSMVQSMTETTSNLKEAFQLDGLSGLADQIGNEIANVATSISENGATTIESATQFVSSLYESLGSTENSAAIGDAAAEILTSLGTGFVETTGEFGVMAGNIISGLVDGLNEADAGQQLADAISSAVSNIGNWFGENGGDLGAAAGELIASLATGIAGHADELIPAGIQIIGGLVQGLIQGAAKLVGAIPSIMGSLVSGIANAIPALIDAGKGVGMALKEGAESVAIDLNEIFKFSSDYGEASAEAQAAMVENAEEMAAAIKSVWQSEFTVDTLGLNPYMAEGENLVKDYVQSWVDAGATIEDVQGQINEVLSGPVDPGTAQAIQSAGEIYGELANEAANVVAANQEAAAAVQDTANAIEEIGDSGETASEAMETVNAAMESLSGSGGLDDIAAELDEMATGLEETQGAADGLKEALTFDGFAGDLADDLLSADDIQARADEVSTAMQTIATNVSTSMSELETTFSTFGTMVGESLSNISTDITSFDTSISTMGTNVGATFDSLSTTVSTAMSAVASAVETQGSAAVSSAESAADGIRAAFENINLEGVAAQMMAGLVNGINAGAADAIAAAESVASQVAAAMSSALAINSPSKVTYDIGAYTSEGFTNAMLDAVPEAYSAADALARAAEAGFANIQESPISQLNSMPGQGAGMYGQPAAQPKGMSGPITFSPTINIQGNADEGSVRNALRWGFDEFEKLMDRYMWQRGREAFST